MDGGTDGAAHGHSDLDLDCAGLLGDNVGVVNGLHNRRVGAVDIQGITAFRRIGEAENDGVADVHGTLLPLGDNLDVGAVVGIVGEDGILGRLLLQAGQDDAGLVTLHGVSTLESAHAIHTRKAAGGVHGGHGVLILSGNVGEIGNAGLGLIEGSLGGHEHTTIAQGVIHDLGHVIAGNGILCHALVPNPCAVEGEERGAVQDTQLTQNFQAGGPPVGGRGLLGKLVSKQQPGYQGQTCRGRRR